MVSIFKFDEWRSELKKSLLPLLFSVVLFIFAGILFYFHGKYNDSIVGCIAPDFILDKFHAMPLGGVFVGGIFFFISLFILYPLFFRVKLLAKAIGQFAFVVFVRDIFMILTHLQVPADVVPVSYPLFANFWNFNNDLFFSGHVAIPFLGFLIFRDSRIRWFFLAGSIFMGAVALLTHRHYSIDVFAAFFIAYGCFKLFNWIFDKKRLGFLMGTK